MKKLIYGIVDFRQKHRQSYKEIFLKLAQGQSPDTLFIACSDSRVVPNLFASTDPGDLFVIRNVGNFVPSYAMATRNPGMGEGAAIEFALSNLQVSEVIVCGHSGCGAMRALLNPGPPTQAPFLQAWLEHGKIVLETRRTLNFKEGLSRQDQISQLNVLEQLAHLKSYPIVNERIQRRTLRLHGWWFDLADVSVHAYEESENRFQLIDEVEAALILERLKNEGSV